MYFAVFRAVSDYFEEYGFGDPIGNIMGNFLPQIVNMENLRTIASVAGDLAVVSNDTA